MDFWCAEGLCCQHGASPVCNLANLLKVISEEKGKVLFQTRVIKTHEWGFLGVLGCTCKGRGSYEAGCATFQIHIKHIQCCSLLRAKRKSLKAFIFKLYRQKKIKPGQSLVLGRSLSECRGHPAPRQTPSAERGTWCGNWNPVCRFHDKNQKTKEQKTTDKYTELFKLKEI